MNPIIDIGNKVFQMRKNPLLILDLKEIKRLDVLTIHSTLYGKNFENLDVILQTPGGEIDAAFNYAKLIRKTAKNINIIVPFYSKSAGILLCLIADKILMTELSELGPLDTQIREDQDGDAPQYNSALNGFKALEQVQQHTLETLDIATKLIITRSGMKISEAFHLATEFSGHTSGTLYSQLNPKKIGEYARALEIGERYGKLVLTRYMGWDENMAKNTVNTLVYNYPSHGFVIDYEELCSIGLPAEKVDSDLAPILFEMRASFNKTSRTLIHLIEDPENKKSTKVNKSKS